MPTYVRRRSASLVVPGILWVAMAAGCASISGGAQPAQERVGNEGALSGAIVLQGDALQRVGGGVALLDAIRHHVGSMQVTRQSGSSCPVIQFRGSHTIRGVLTPAVYVNETHMLDTCVLDRIHVNDVRRVEVYRRATTGGSGYAMSPGGMILVYLTEEWRR